MSDQTSDQTSEVPRPPDARTAPDITAPLPVRRSTSPKPGQVALAFIAVAAGAFLLGIAISTSDGRRSDGEVLAETDVGTAGRTITFDRGQIVFPRGAVARPIHVVVSLLSEEGHRGFRFEPSDVAFARPVEIILRLPDGARNGVVVRRHGGGTTLLGGNVDPDREIVSVEVDDFGFEGDDL